MTSLSFSLLRFFFFFFKYLVNQIISFEWLSYPLKNVVGHEILLVMDLFAVVHYGVHSELWCLGI